MSKQKVLRKVVESVFSLGLFIYNMPVLALAAELGNSGVMATQAKIQNNLKKYKEGEIVVKFKSGRSALNLLQTRSKYNLKEKRVLDHSTTKLLTFDPRTPVDQVIKELKDSGQVEYAEPNYVRKKASMTDPLYGLQWGLRNTGQSIDSNPGTAGFDMGAEYAWSQTKGNTSVIVGVIDTGIDINHPELKGQIWKNPGEIPGDGIDNDNDGYIDDVYGWDFANDDNTVFDSADYDDHGTHVAGIIAAKNDSFGVVGVAPNVKIMPLKFLTADGGTIADEIEALSYAKAKGVKIINMSLGGYGFSQAEYDAIKNMDALIVAASGNEGANNDDSDPSYPASYDLPNIISVAAMDNNGQIPYWSNYGATTVDLAAPGVDIVSTIPGDNGNYAFAYTYFSGTSMAAPFVTGTAALLLSKYTSFSPLTIKDCILDTTNYLPFSAGKVHTMGMLHAGRAVYMDTTIPTVPKVNKVTEQSNKINGEAEAGSTVTIKVGATFIGQGLATAEGTFSIAIPVQKAGTELTITATDKAGNSSVGFTVKVVAVFFTDLQSVPWAKEAIETMAGLGIVNGVGNNRFDPDNNVTRAQFARLIIKTLGITGTASNPFTDVKSSDWFANDVALAYKYGIVNGVTATEFAPESPITRQEMAVMMMRAIKYKQQVAANDVNGTLSKYTDHYQIDSWAIEGVVISIEQGLMNGMTQTTFSPKTNATRAQSAVIMYRFYQKFMK